MTDPVLAATAWNTNADMILDCVQLGYLRKEWLTLDPTYGKGNWWTKWEPDLLVKSDINPQAPCMDPADFTSLPYATNAFDVVTFDPPYVCIGGRKTGSMQDMHAAYGMTDAPKSPAELQALINAGLAECRRVVKPGGLILVKMQDYISSGKFWNGTYRTQRWAEYLFLETIDRLEHVAKAPRPQPAGRRQVHARRNLSTLLVLQKGKR